MAAQFVIPYRRRDKNDANDAEAICEAVGRPNMRFVAIKSEEQQSVLMVHRARTLVVANRTAQVNQIRGLLGEFELVVPKGVARLRRELPGILEDAENGLATPPHSGSPLDSARAAAKSGLDRSLARAIATCEHSWCTARERTCASSTRRPMRRAPGRDGSRSVDT